MEKILETKNGNIIIALYDWNKLTILNIYSHKDSYTGITVHKEFGKMIDYALTKQKKNTSEST